MERKGERGPEQDLFREHSDPEPAQAPCGGKADQPVAEIHDVDADDQLTIDIEEIGDAAANQAEDGEVRNRTETLAGAPQQPVIEQKDAQCVEKGRGYGVPAVTVGYAEDLGQGSQAEQQAGRAKEQQMAKPSVP